MNPEAASISVTFLVAALLIGLAVGAAAGYFLGKRRNAAEPQAPLSALPKSLEDADDPTAPITPMIEIGRSPHDRHRDLTVGNSLVKNIEMLEFILKGGERRDRDELVRQITLLKSDFHSLLGNCSFRPFEYAPGTVVETGIRNRIQIVGGKAGEERTKILKTLRCGFLYEPGGGEDPVVIRKAEVEIG